MNQKKAQTIQRAMYLMDTDPLDRGLSILDGLEEFSSIRRDETGDITFVDDLITFKWSRNTLATVYAFMFMAVTSPGWVWLYNIICQVNERF